MMNDEKIVDIEGKMEHKTSEVICINCKYRWLAVRPITVRLKDLECPKCNAVGNIIETGEDIL